MIEQQQDASEASKKIKIVMEEQYIEQQSQKNYYKQVREQLKQHQNLMQQQI